MPAYGYLSGSNIVEYANSSFRTVPGHYDNFNERCVAIFSIFVEAKKRFDEWHSCAVGKILVFPLKHVLPVFVDCRIGIFFVLFPEDRVGFFQVKKSCCGYADNEGVRKIKSHVIPFV